MLLHLGVSSLLCVTQAVAVAAAEVWSVLREGDASCRLSRAPSAVPYAHALAPLASRCRTSSGWTCSVLTAEYLRESPFDLKAHHSSCTQLLSALPGCGHRGHT